MFTDLPPPKMVHSLRRDVGVLIPALNEESTIAKIILQARRFADTVIVCDDGSKDLTGEIAKVLGAEVIRHNHNLGYGAALNSLFRRAIQLGIRIAVTIDGDGQHNPDWIPRLVEPILSGDVDIVMGSRFSNNGDIEIPRLRRAGVRTINRLTRLISH